MYHFNAVFIRFKYCKTYGVCIRSQCKSKKVKKIKKIRGWPTVMTLHNVSEICVPAMNLLTYGIIGHTEDEIKVLVVFPY